VVFILPGAVVVLGLALLQEAPGEAVPRGVQVRVLQVEARVQAVDLKAEP